MKEHIFFPSLSFTLFSLRSFTLWFLYKTLWASILSPVSGDQAPNLQGSRTWDHGHEWWGSDGCAQIICAEGEAAPANSLNPCPFLASSCHNNYCAWQLSTTACHAINLCHPPRQMMENRGVTSEPCSLREVPAESRQVPKCLLELPECLALPGRSLLSHFVQQGGLHLGRLFRALVGFALKISLCFPRSLHRHQLLAAPCTLGVSKGTLWRANPSWGSSCTFPG